MTALRPADLSDPDGFRTTASPEPARAAGGWFAVTATVMAGVAPLLLMSSTPLRPATSPVWIWAAMLTVVVGLRYAWLVSLGEQRLFELMFWLFVYVFLGLAPLVQMRTGHYPDTTPFVDTGLNGRAMAVVGLGSAAAAFGIAAGGRGRPPRQRRVLPYAAEHRVHALTAGALVLTAYYVMKIGPSSLFASRAQRTMMENAAWGNPTVAALVRAMSTLPLVVAFVAQLRLREQMASEARRLPVVAPAILGLALIAVLNPISTPRYACGTAALAVLAALGATATKRRLRTTATVLAVGLVLVFPYADRMRYAPEDRTAQQETGPSQTLSKGDYDAFDQINNTVAFVDARGTTEGRQLLGAALFWVPRSVWQSKPEDTGVVLADFRGYDFTNLSAPLWSELFISGGWGLLLVGMGATGWLIRRLDERLVADGRSRGGVRVLTVIMPFYSIILLRGSLLQAMAGLFVIIACSVFVTGRHPLPAL